MNSCWCEVLIHATSPSTGYSSGQNAGVYFSGVSPHRSWTSLSSAKAGREQSNHLGKGETTSAVPSAVGQSGTKEGKSPSESTKIQKIQRQGSPHVKHGTRQHPRGRGMFDLLMCFSPLGFFFPFNSPWMITIQFQNELFKCGDKLPDWGRQRRERNRPVQGIFHLNQPR